MESEHWANHLLHFTARTDDIILTADPPSYKSIPVTYILCEDDAFIPEDLQRTMATNAGASIEALECVGHMPFISKCEDVVEIVGRTTGMLYAGSNDAEEDTSRTGDGDESASTGSAASAPQQEGDDEEFEHTKPLRRSTTAPS
jgi:hypothetical protein